MSAPHFYSTLGGKISVCSFKCVTGISQGLGFSKPKFIYSLYVIHVYLLGLSVKKKRNRGRVLTGIYLSYIVDVKNNIFPLSWGHNVVSGRNHNFYFKILSWYSSQRIQCLGN